MKIIIWAIIILISIFPWRGLIVIERQQNLEIVNTLIENNRVFSYDQDTLKVSKGSSIDN